MKKLYILIFLVLFSSILTEDYWQEEHITLKCGKDNPKSEDDCTDYGTDSGFYCCYIKKGDDISCKLASYGLIKNFSKEVENKTSTEFTAGTTKYVCNEWYLKFIYTSLILILALLF